MNCPYCRHPAVYPVLIPPEGSGGVRTSYRCPGCGSRWESVWLDPEIAAAVSEDDAA